MSEFSGLNLVVVDPFLDVNIQAAINKAKAAPGGAVWIPNSYTGTDTVPATPGVPVFDMRGLGNTTMGSKVLAGAAANVSAATGGPFVTTLNLPGGSAFEQVPFVVKAAGWYQIGGGTYTASVQPLLYASTTAGYTASAAAAIFSAAAVNVTIAVAAAATLTTFPWEMEVTISGDSTSGLITGRCKGSINVSNTTTTGNQQFPTTAASATWDSIPAANAPTGVNFASAIPLQFLCGITFGTTTLAPTTPVIHLGSFFIES
jgi:hypothetical protein